MNITILSFHIGDMLFGIDISLVKEINRNIQYTPMPDSEENILGLFNMRGQIVVLFDLASALGYKTKSSFECNLESPQRLDIDHNHPQRDESTSMHFEEPVGNEHFGKIDCSTISDSNNIKNLSSKTKCIILKPIRDDSCHVGFLIESAGEVFDIDQEILEDRPANLGNIDNNYISKIAKLENDLLIIINPENIFFKETEN